MALIPIGGYITAQELNNNFSYLESIGLRPDYDLLINVKKYGAVGDGATDDTEAINAALKDGSILIPDGTYLVSGIKVPSNRTVLGQSWGTVLILNENAPIGANIISNEDNVNGNENIHVRNLNLDGNRQNRPGASGGPRPGHSCVAFAKCRNSTIKNVYTTSATLHGIDISAANQTYEGSTTWKEGLESESCLVEGCYATDHGDDGITTHYSNHITIKNCFAWDMAAIHTSNSNGIEVDDGGKHIVVEGCQVWNCNDGIEVKGHENTPAPQNVTISNCIVRDCVKGIEVQHLGHSINNPSPSARNLSVVGCHAINCEEMGIRVAGYRYFSVDNCHVSESPDITTGAILTNSGAGMGIIKGCTIKDSPNASGGVTVGSTFTSGLTISNIITENTGRGIAVLESEDVIVTGCHVTGPGEHGLFVGQNVNHVKLISNFARGFETNIHISSLASNVTDEFNN